MKLIDLHCDTLWKLMDLDRTGDLYKSGCAVTIPDMKKAGTVAQFFACFTYLEDYRKGNGYEEDVYKRQSCYIVIVPLLGVFLHKKIGWKVWVAVGIALIGLYFLCITESPVSYTHLNEIQKYSKRNTYLIKPVDMNIG